MAKLIEREADGGRIKEYWSHYDDRGKRVLTHRAVQDVEPIFKLNRREFNDAPKVAKGGETFRKVATIPHTLFENFIKLKGIPYPEMMERKTDRAKAAWHELLNSRDLRKLRTHPGKV